MAWSALKSKLLRLLHLSRCHRNPPQWQTYHFRGGSSPTPLYSHPIPWYFIQLRFAFAILYWPNNSCKSVTSYHWSLSKENRHWPQKSWQPTFQLFRMDANARRDPLSLSALEYLVMDFGRNWWCWTSVVFCRGFNFALVLMRLVASPWLAAALLAQLLAFECFLSFARFLYRRHLGLAIQLDRKIY